MTNNSELKKTKQSRFKLPSEIERWAYSNESTDEPSKINNENDDYEDIDDSYLQIYDDPNDRKKVIDKNEQKKRVVEILNQVKSRKLARTADITTKKRNSFNSLISNIISANSNFDLIKQEQSLSMLKINDQTEEEDEHEKKSHKKKPRDESKKFRSISSGISRAVPGSLQQNITIERNFFKDLLKLSKQRYITKINADFQKKRFLIKQTNKGLYAEKESNNQIPRSHSSVVPRQSHVSISNKYTNRELKSISAFAKRRSDSITESYLKLDSSENMTKSVKMIKNVLDYNSEDEEHQNVKKEVSNNNNNNKTKNNLRSNLKRPNTTLALSHNGQISSSSSIHNEVKYQLNDNKYYIIDEQNAYADNLFMLSKPTNDQRFKSLISSMSNFKPRNDQETNKPDILVKKLINSNTALQKQGTTSKELSDTKRTALIEINMKLFEKIVSNIN